MSDMQMNFRMDNHNFATIRVIGVGGGGCNAVDRMIEAEVQGIDFIAINTDNQALQRSKATQVIQIGDKVTRGLGAGADPEIGRKAAEESAEEIERAIDNTDMLFITAGMGGGTGTGAAPVVAEIARSKNILTVAVVTKPFRFEGTERMRIAEQGIRDLEQYVDSLIIVPNDKLLEATGDAMTFTKALEYADHVLKLGVTSISDLVAVPGLINLDLADIRRVMVDAGICHMGIGQAEGDNRAATAIKAAINSPLLDTTIDNARGVIISFVSGPDFKIQEIDAASSIVRESVAPEANIIIGATINEALNDQLIITVIASGFGQDSRGRQSSNNQYYGQTRTRRTEARPSVEHSIFGSRQEETVESESKRPAQAAPSYYPNFIAQRNRKQEQESESPKHSYFARPSARDQALRPGSEVQDLEDLEARPKQEPARPAKRRPAKAHKQMWFNTEQDEDLD